MKKYINTSMVEMHQYKARTFRHIMYECEALKFKKHLYIILTLAQKTVTPFVLSMVHYFRV